MLCCSVVGKGIYHADSYDALDDTQKIVLKIIWFGACCLTAPAAQAFLKRYNFKGVRTVHTAENVLSLDQRGVMMGAMCLADEVAVPL